MKKIIIILAATVASFAFADSKMATKTYVDAKDAETYVNSVCESTNSAEAVVHEAVRTNYLCTVDDANRDFVGTNKANSVGSGFSIVAGGSSVLGIGRDETDSQVWRGGLYAKGVIDDYGTRKYGIKVEKNEYSPYRGRVCVMDVDHYYREPIASSNDVERMSRSIATNAAEAVVHEAVRTNYLCTVEAAEEMTNAIPRIVSGGDEIRADKTVTHTVEFANWTPDSSQTSQTQSNMAWKYEGIGWSDGNWYCGAYFWDDYYGWVIDHGELMSGPQANDPNATELTFPDGTKTYLRRTFTTRLATTNDVAGVVSQEVAQVQAQVSAIGAHLNAEDAHFVSTNYDSVTRLPEAYVEIKMNGNWLTIWREMTRWNAFVGNGFDWDTWQGFYTFKTNVTEELTMKADRAWGAYDSETGGYAPDNCTQISSSNILIAANMGFQKRVVTGGAVWVLQCNDGVASLNVDTNGYFRIEDSEGNTQFEIVRGDKQELGADASGITVNNSTTPPTVTIPYSVEADEHPTLQICGNIATHDWKAETAADCIATVTWSGSSGAYVATVRAKNAQNAASLFVKASYLADGETYIHNVAPVGMSSIILNGTKYYLGTATISGHTVLTLSTTPPNGN